jgi:tetratricopeptide (TPR) repeat protein
MQRVVWAAVLLIPLGVLCGQPQAPISLAQAQSLIDQGKLSDAGTEVRRYLEAHPDSADAHYLLGYILFREGDAKASLAEYTAGARYRAPAALDLEAMGSDCFLLEDYAAAEQWFAKSVELNPGDARAQYYLGRTRYNEKHFEEAVRALTAALKLEPANAKAADYLGLSYEALGKTEDALGAYRAAVAAGARDAGPYLDLGALLAGNGKADEAVQYLREAVRMDGGDARAHQELGKAYLALNRFAEAQAELEKAAGIAPENAPVHFLLAEAYKKGGLADKARAEAGRYAALTGAHSAPDSPLAEARSLVGLGRSGEAESVVRRYLEAHKNSADAHYLLGYILFKKQDARASLAEYTEGAKSRTPSPADLEAVAADYVLLKDYPDADKWFTKAVEWNPADALGWYYLGRTKYNENRFEEAIHAFEQCLKLEPRNVKAEDNLGLSYEGLNRTAEAMTAYRTAIAWQAGVAAKDSGPLFDLGSLLVDSNRAQEGMPYLLEAARISPGDSRVHRQLGKAYTHLGRLDQARAELEKAAELAPQNAPIHFMLAQVYRKQGFQDKAKLENERYAALAGGGSSEH